jgi:hypothetical protein
MSDGLVKCRRRLAVSAATLLGSAGILASVTASAQAATTLGQTGPVGLCNGAYGQVQDPGGSGPGYTVPVDGVITSFSAASDRAGLPIRLLILQPVSGTTYTVVAQSEQGYFTAPGVQTFPAQISVRAGQVIGDWGWLCGTPTGNAADHFHYFKGNDPALGAPQDFDIAGPGGARANLSANLEPAAAAPGPGTSGAAQKCKKHKKHKSAAAAKKKHCKKKKKR